jgi:hypothetical protein
MLLWHHGFTYLGHTENYEQEHGCKGSDYGDNSFPGQRLRSYHLQLRKILLILMEKRFRGLRDTHFDDSGKTSQDDKRGIGASCTCKLRFLGALLAIYLPSIPAHWLFCPHCYGGGTQDQTQASSRRTAGLSAVRCHRADAHHRWKMKIIIRCLGRTAIEAKLPRYLIRAEAGFSAIRAFPGRSGDNEAPRPPRRCRYRISKHPGRGAAVAD